MKKIQDHYFKEARKQGYVARSAFKLEEMDRKFRLLRRGQHVIDLGCAPGSWLQYAAKKVLPEGSLTGVDLNQVKIHFPESVRIFQSDIYWKKVFWLCPDSTWCSVTWLRIPPAFHPWIANVPMI